MRQNINLSSFGRKVLRWDIEVPNSEQVQAALEMASSEGRSGPLIQMLKRMAHPSALAALDANNLVTNTMPNAIAPSQSISSFRQKVLGWHQHGQSTIERIAGLTHSLHPRTWLKQTKTIAWILIPALTLSTLLMLWLQPQSFGIKTPTPPVVKSQPSSTPIAPIGDSSSASPPESSAAANPAPNIPASPAPSVIEPDPQPVDTSKDTRQTRTWIKGLDPQSFLLQYGTAKTMDKALEVLNGLADIKNTAIVEAYYPGESVEHFVIVSGPYAQVNEGYIAARKTGIPNGSWVRSTRTLQSQIDPALPKQDIPR
jgi:hypothetical protein